MELGLRDKVALVCGGSRGIGFAAAEDLVREGARVVICARDAGSLARAAEALRAVGGVAATIAANALNAFKLGGDEATRIANLLAAAALVATSEAMAMGVKAGLDARVLIDIINASSGRNSATQDKFPRAILPRTFDFGFATALSYKDVRLCVEEAEAMGVPMVVGSAVRQMLAVTKARFGADSDFTHVAKLLEEWAGVEIRG